MLLKLNVKRFLTFLFHRFSSHLVIFLHSLSLQYVMTRYTALSPTSVFLPPQNLSVMAGLNAQMSRTRKTVLVRTNYFDMEFVLIKYHSSCESMQTPGLCLTECLHNYSFHY